MADYPPGYGPPSGLQHRIPRHPDYYYLRAAGGFYLWHQGRYFGRDHFVQAFATFADMADHVDRVDPR